MSSVLIITMPSDDHSAAVAWALRELGHRCDLWYGVPSVTQPGSYTIGTNQPEHITFEGVDGPFTMEDFDVIWDRRLPRPIFPSSMPTEDQKVGLAELGHFIKGCLFSFAVSEDVFLANNPIAAHTADNKIFQLEAARSTGLNIPDTLFSTDVSEVRRFAKQAPQGIIYKGFKPHVWKNDKAWLWTYAALLKEADLGEGVEFEFCPGIFQHFKPKAYELRVSIFGHTAIAAKISNQNPVDWRSEQHNMTLEPYTLPAEIEGMLFQLMARLGIVMGMADLIVTEDGEYVFLEVNHQGQFTWIEGMNSAIPVLEACAKFLASRDPHFLWERDEAILLTIENFGKSEAYKQYRQRLEAFTAAEMDAMGPPPQLE